MVCHSGRTPDRVAGVASYTKESVVVCWACIHHAREGDGALDFALVLSSLKFRFWCWLDCSPPCSSCGPDSCLGPCPRKPAWRLIDLSGEAFNSRSPHLVLTLAPAVGCHIAQGAGVPRGCQQRQAVVCRGVWPGMPIFWGVSQANLPYPPISTFSQDTRNCGQGTRVSRIPSS